MAPLGFGEKETRKLGKEGKEGGKRRERERFKIKSNRERKAKKKESPGTC